MTRAGGPGPACTVPDIRAALAGRTDPWPTWRPGTSTTYQQLTRREPTMRDTPAPAPS